MIPKVIHYVWVGPAKKPSSVEKCINSWKKNCPDYQIIEWNEKSFESIKNRYLEEAYAAGKYAFVSDVLRLHALLSGGIYCDTDLEITKNLDVFLENSFFMSFEFNPAIRTQIKVPSTALIGSEANSAVIKDLLEEYKTLRFKKEDGSYDLTPNVMRFQRYFQKNYKYAYARSKIDEKLQLAPGIVIFPFYFFSRPIIGHKNYAIHHFDGSWLPPISKKIILGLHSEVFSFLNIKIIGYRKNKTCESLSEFPPPSELQGRVLCRLPWVRNSVILLCKDHSFK